MTQTIKKGKVGMNLTEGSILRCLVIFAIPIVLTNLVQQLYSMVDLAVIGQYVGTLGTIGVNTGGEIADLVAPIAMGFSTAGQIYISQLYGAREEGKIKKTVGTLLSFMIFISIVLALVAIFFHTPILNLINCPKEAMDQASAYMVITAIGFPFIFGYYAVCGILRGMGESKRPLIFILVAAVINVVLDLVLVAGFHMEAAGTAIATVLAQIGSFGAAFIFMLRNREKFDFEARLSYFKLDGEVMKIIIKLGVPQVVRSLLVRFSMLWVNSTANSYGVIVSSTNSIGNKLQKFLEVFVQGVDTASASMVGQNLGARKIERAGKTTIYTLGCTLVCATVTSLLCLFCPKVIFGLFTKDPLVLDLGVTLYYGFENLALSATRASNVGVIISIAPFFTVLFSAVFLKEKRPGLRFFAGFLIAMAGIMLISFNQEAVEIHPAGDGLAVLAAMIWAVYCLLSRRISELGYNVLLATRRTFFYGLLFMLPLTFTQFSVSLPTILRPEILFNLVFLGLGASALCFVTWNLAVGILGSVKTSVTIYIVPVITAVASALVLHEPLTSKVILGLALTLGGLVLSQNINQEKEQKEQYGTLE